jgi:hypothetical protein
MSAALALDGRMSIATELSATVDERRMLAVVVTISVSKVTVARPPWRCLDNRKHAENQFFAL